ncbi:MAG: ribokinase [Roseovarius sp.]
MIYNFGSINADYIYDVPHLPGPGETLASTGFSRQLGGKGANQSVAVARAGRSVRHIGAIGADGTWMQEAMRNYGVETTHITTVDGVSGHAVVNVDTQGENAIVLHPGANVKQSLTKLKQALSGSDQSDILMLQNETNLQPEVAQFAKGVGLYVIYTAAPFDAEAVHAVLPYIDLLVMNAVEATQLHCALGDVGVPHKLITHGADGADWIEPALSFHMSSFPVTPIDTTGAGDCFVGYVAAGLDQGLKPETALRRASAASALQVQKKGTAEAIPSLSEVEAFLA